MSDLTIGPIADDAELDVFGRIVAQSLLFPRPTDPSHADWMAREGREPFRVARRDGRIVGGLSVQPFGQWIGGRPVPTGGVRAVAVLPEVRAQGVASKLLRASFEEMRAAGIPISTLFPATTLVYRRAGYELAGARTLWRVATADLAGLGDKAGGASAARSGAAAAARDVPMTRLEAPTRERLDPAYRRRAAAGCGNLDRNDWLWQRVLDPVGGPPGFVYTAGEDGPDGPDGYVVYVTERIPGQFLGEMRLRDLVANTPQALRRIAAFFADHRSMLLSVLWYGAPVDPLVQLLDNPAAKIDQRWDWMLRLVDVERALEARGYGPGRTLEVDLRVTDALLPWNDGAFTLAIADGKATVTRGGSPRSAVKAHVRGLAALYTGYAGAHELAARGLLEGADDDLGRLESAFAGPAPWMPDMF